jgi:hypothetical protein
VARTIVFRRPCLSRNRKKAGHEDRWPAPRLTWSVFSYFLDTTVAARPVCIVSIPSLLITRGMMRGVRVQLRYDPASRSVNHQRLLEHEISSQTAHDALAAEHIPGHLKNMRAGTKD